MRSRFVFARNEEGGKIRAGSIEAEPSKAYRARVRARMGGRFTPWTEWVTSNVCRGFSAPPAAPTGVTASCRAGALSISWNLVKFNGREVSSYEPRIFVGGSAAADSRWNASISGSTSATIPASGEPDLPDSGVFQVRVRSVNNSTPSAYSAPVDVTCGLPDSPSGVECTAISKNRITLRWDTVPGALGYRYGAVIRGYTNVSTLDATAGDDFSNSSAPISGVSLDLGVDGDYTLWAWAYNDNGRSGTASVDCGTISDTWVNADCSGAGIIRVRWDDPSGTQTAPSGYTGSIILAANLLDGQVASYDEAYDSNTTSVEWTAIGAPSSEYQVSIQSKNANGGPVYSQTKTVTCPPLSVSILTDCKQWPANSMQTRYKVRCEVPWASINSVNIHVKPTNPVGDTRILRDIRATGQVVDIFLSSGTYQVALQPSGIQGNRILSPWSTVNILEGGAPKPDVSLLSNSGFKCAPLNVAYDPRGRYYAETHTTDYECDNVQCPHAPTWTAQDFKWVGVQNCNTDEPLEFVPINYSNLLGVNRTWQEKLAATMSLVTDLIFSQYSPSRVQLITKLLDDGNSTYTKNEEKRRQNFIDSLSAKPSWVAIMPVWRTHTSVCLVAETYSDGWGGYQVYSIPDGVWIPEVVKTEVSSTYTIDGESGGIPYSLKKGLIRVGQTCRVESP